MDKEYVDIDKLKIMANNIDIRRDEIMTLYKMKIRPLMEFSRESIKDNISIIEIDKIFNALFKELNTRLSELIVILDKDIIPNYEDLSSDIKELFNNQFASKMESLLDVNDE